MARSIRHLARLTCIYHSASTAWEIQTSGNNSAFVAKAGDVMSGLLTPSGRGQFPITPQ